MVVTTWRRHGARAVPAVVLSVLVVQNAYSMLLQHELQTPSDARPVLFGPLSAVTLSEALKLIVSLLAAFWTFSGGAVSSSNDNLRSSAPTAFLTTLRSGHDLSAIPAFLYTVSAAAQSFGAYHLEVLPYMMLSQTKLILTPLFAGAFLGQRLQPHQWACIVTMACGMVLVQHGSATVTSSQHDGGGRDTIIGAICMLVAGGCSAGAGVYMESVLKVSQGRFMVRNAQLASYALLCALGGFLWRNDFDLKDFFRGYHPMVWVLVLFQATGGFLVSWAVSITSSVAKNYAQSVGFLLASTIPLLGLHQMLSVELYCGIVLVLGGVFGSLWMKDVGKGSREMATKEKAYGGESIV